jgi:RNA-directed DNA polymerase
MKLFDVGSVDQLAKMLAVLPGEIYQALSNRDRFYRTRKIPKPNGKVRLLQVPVGALKILQHKIKNHIFDQVRPLDCVHGGVVGRSVMTNARPHVGKEIVFALDVKDFFPRVSPQCVTAIFGALGFRLGIAEMLTSITTWNGQLPQGAPTSTSLANLAMMRVGLRSLPCGTLQYRRQIYAPRESRSSRVNWGMGY